jgi:hypothetical protein
MPKKESDFTGLQKLAVGQIRAFLAYLAFHSIFFQHENAGRGAYRSFLSQSAFFFRKALWSHERSGQIQGGPYLLWA